MRLSNANRAHTTKEDEMTHTSKRTRKPKCESQYIVTYHHRDTQETIYRVCNSLKTANDWAEWTKRQKWVEPGTVEITVQQGGMLL